MSLYGLKVSNFSKIRHFKKQMKVIDYHRSDRAFTDGFMMMKQSVNATFADTLKVYYHFADEYVITLAVP